MLGGDQNEGGGEREREGKREEEREGEGEERGKPTPLLRPCLGQRRDKWFPASPRYGEADDDDGDRDGDSV